MTPGLFNAFLNLPYRVALRRLDLQPSPRHAAAWASAHARRAARERASPLIIPLPCDQCEREVVRRYLVGTDHVCVYCKRKKEH